MPVLGPIVFKVDELNTKLIDRLISIMLHNSQWKGQRKARKGNGCLDEFFIFTYDTHENQLKMKMYPILNQIYQLKSSSKYIHET